ncbi:hypothetical protein ACR9YC_12225 [Parasphingorhabdus sp. DH2-15]|uniref:hypothetical protein n=1 Tax=Parasphingorhabdus sp. DH2-15 TaxID=3444112 RepID=UPI003F6826E7
MPKPSNLDNPEIAAFAWGRFRRMMRLMGLITLAAILIGFAWLYWQHGFVSVHVYIGAALGIGVTIMLTGLLMGLVFLSHGTGHDESIDDNIDADWQDNEN